MKNGKPQPKKPTLSFIIPAMNEEPTIRTLFDGIREHVTGICSNFEVIFIDDGSTDGTWSVMEGLAEEFPGQVKALRHRTNFGKANALSVGYAEADGEYVFTMDADLQDDPAEIPRFLEKIEEGFDIVSGYKQKRHDPWHKVLPSRVFNKIISKVGGVDLHDHNCGFKCYRAEVVKTLPMYGGMHRMVPSIAAIFGFRTGEIVVQHHARQFGVSKYGVKRILHGIADIITVGFIKNFRDRPNNALAIISFVLALGAISLAGISNLLAMPAFLVSLFTIVSIAALSSSFVLFFLGILAEMEVWRTVLPTGNLHISDKVGLRYGSQTETKAPRHIAVPKKALIADDDPRMVSLLSNYLCKEEWKVITASSVSEAVENVTDDIQVAFVDVHMPGPSHREALRLLRGKGPGTRIVSLSSDPDERLPFRAQGAGASTFLAKPVSRRVVLEQANQSLEAGELEAEAPVLSS